MASALIKDVRVLDGRGLREGRQDVEIRDGRLQDVRPHRQGEPAPGTPAFDGEGMHLLPGLIDLHVHLVWDGSPDPVDQLRNESKEQTLLRAVRHSRETIQAGITTVRDLGSVDDLAVDLSRAVERGDILGPRIVPSGRTIIMTGGHDPFWGLMVDGPQEALKAARRQIYRGAGVIKLSATGGVYGRTEGESATHTELNLDEIRAVTREAHKLGVPVVLYRMLRGLPYRRPGIFLLGSLIVLLLANGVSGALYGTSSEQAGSPSGSRSHTEQKEPRQAAERTTPEASPARKYSIRSSATRRTLHPRDAFPRPTPAPP